MFKLVKEPTTWARIEWSALDEAGFEQANEIEMQVLLVGMTELEELISPSETHRTLDFAKHVARDWRDIIGPDGKPFPFNPENLEVLFDVPGFSVGFFASYLEAWRGRGKVREKNSPGSPEDGRAEEKPSGSKPARRTS